MQEHLTNEQRITNNDTWWHIHRVRQLIGGCIRELLSRSEEHGLTKLDNPEVALFAEVTPKLAGCTYGSAEYEDYRKQLSTALAHHYGQYRHHPEHFKNGIDDMNLIDLMEMLCDWKASSERHNDGNILKSIEKNASRFTICPQLVKILENTAALFDE